MFEVTYNIIRREGAMSLWTGVGPAITRHYIYTGIRMGAYEVLREAVYDKDTEKTFPVWKSMLCGALSGLVAQFAASPTDLIKVFICPVKLKRLVRFKCKWKAFVDCKTSLCGIEEQSIVLNRCTELKVGLQYSSLFFGIFRILWIVGWLDPELSEGCSFEYV